ncbi:SH3 domain-containing protein [Polaromonas sp.]|uniref:SH3 domain-containing protein n=1 Tax=Polaromonas sp. TaxID=1869339 RepID=UPI003BB6581B
MKQPPSRKVSRPMGFAGLDSLPAEKPELDSELTPHAAKSLVDVAHVTATETADLEHMPATDKPFDVQKIPAGPSPIGWSAGWIWATILGAIVIFGAALNSFRQVDPRQSAASAAAPSLKSAARKMLVVASMAANIRAKPTVQSKLLHSLKKGDRIEFVGVSGTFTQVNLADGTLAYVASELVIPESDFLRLESMSPAKYIDLRRSERRIESLFEQIEPLKDSILEILFQVSNRNAQIDEKLHMIEAIRGVVIEADGPAGIWFSLAARAAANGAQFDDASLNARAAVEADPMNADYQVAFALSNYSLGRVEPVRFASHALIAIAPRATNTWMLLGLSEAMDESETKLDSLATGSFILAIKLSRNSEATRKYFKDLIAKSKNPRVQQLLRDAMIEEALTASVFGL